MDLHYSVIIDTKQAEFATEQLEELFNSIGKGADDSSKDIVRMGRDLVGEMKRGSISTKETAKWIEELREEIQRMAKAGKFVSKDSKQFASQANFELQRLLTNVKKYEHDRETSHKNEIKRLNEERKAEERKAKAEESLARQRNNRLSSNVNGAIGNAAQSQGSILKELMGGGSMLAGGFKFGAIGVVISLISNLLDRYKEDIEAIVKVADGFLDKINWYFDYIVGGLKALYNNLISGDWTNPVSQQAENAANKKALDDFIKKSNNEKKDNKELIDLITNTNKESQERQDAWKKLLKHPAFSSLDAEKDLITYSKDGDKLRKMLDEYYKTEVDKELVRIYADKSGVDEKFEDLLKNERFDAERKIDDLNAKLSLISRSPSSYLEKYNNDLYNSDKELRGIDIEAAVESMSQEEYQAFLKRNRAISDEIKKYIADEEKKITDELKKARLDLASVDTKMKTIPTQDVKKDYLEKNGVAWDLTEEGKRQKARLEQEEEQRRLLESQAKKKDEEKKRDLAKKELEQAKKELKSISPAMIDDSLSEYERSLKAVEEDRKKAIETLNKYSKYNDTQEYKDAEERIKTNTAIAVSQIEKVKNEYIDTFNKAFEESTLKSDYEVDKSKIQNTYDKLRKEINAKLKKEDADALIVKAEKMQAVEEENLLTSKTIKEIKELEEARKHELDVEYAEMTQKEKAKKNDVFDYEIRSRNILIDSIEKQIEAKEKEVNLTEEEIKEITSLKRALELLKKEQQAYNKELEETNEAKKKIDWGGVAGTIGGSLSYSSNGYLSGFGNALNGIGSSYNSAKERKENGEKANANDYAQAASSLIQFGIEAYDGIEESKKRCKEALDEWNQTISNSAHRLAMLNIEQWEYRQKNIFGVEDPYNRLNSYLRQGAEAQKELAEAFDKLGKQGRVQVGMATEREVQSMATYAGGGATAGAAVGSLFSPIGTAIGAGVGAIAGAIVGYFASEDLVPVYDSLKNKYGELYDYDTLELNKELLADYEKMDDATQRMIDNVEELLDKQKEIRQNWEDYIKDLVGDLGNDLSDVLYNAFVGDRMKDAVSDMKSYLEGTLSNILQTTIFGNLFEAQFTSLQEQLSGGLIDEQGNLVGDIAETIASFLPTMEDGLRQYEALMEEVQSRYKEYGLDIFQSEANQSQEALQGGISSMTEDTASKLNGNFMGLKLSSLEISDKVGSIRSMIGDANTIANNSLNVLREIAENTSFCHRLESLANDIASIKNNGITVR